MMAHRLGRRAARLLARTAAIAAAVVALLAASPVAGLALGAPSPTPQAVKYYVVKPAVGGRTEFLFDIASRTLGDGKRYFEIFVLNQNREQPDGGRLVDPAVLRPGWILVLPFDAAGPDVRTGPLPTPTPTQEPATGGGTNSLFEGGWLSPLCVLAVIATMVLALRRPGRGRTGAVRFVRSWLRRGDEPPPSAPPGEPAAATARAGGASTPPAVEPALIAALANHLRPSAVPAGPGRTGEPGPATTAVQAPTPDSAAPGSAPEWAGARRPSAQTGASASTSPPAAPANRAALGGRDRSANPEDGNGPRREPRPTLDPTLGPTLGPAFAGGSPPVQRSVQPRPEPAPSPRSAPLPPAEGRPQDSAVEVTVRSASGGETAAVRLLGIRLRHGGPAWMWRDPDAPRASTATVVALGVGAEGAFCVDVAQVPDVLTLTGDAAGSRRLAASIAQQLVDATVNVVVVGDAIGPTAMGIPTVGSLAEASKVRTDSGPLVVFTGGQPDSAAAIRQLTVGGTHHTVVVLVGPGHRSRWSVDVQPAATSRS